MNEYFCEFVFLDASRYQFFVTSDSIVNAYLKAINLFNSKSLNMSEVTYFNIEKM